MTITFFCYYLLFFFKVKFYQPLKLKYFFSDLSDFCILSLYKNTSLCPYEFTNISDNILFTHVNDMRNCLMLK